MFMTYFFWLILSIILLPDFSAHFDKERKMTVEQETSTTDVVQVRCSSGDRQREGRRN